MSSFLNKLAEICGTAHVLTDDATARYTSDYRRQYQGQCLCVVRPGSAAEIAEIVSLLEGEGIAIVPQGGNTSSRGSATPLSEGRSVVLSLERLSSIRSIDLAGATMTVDAGCTLAEVQSAAIANGFTFPVQLGSAESCQIGGMIATNAGGNRVLRFGRMREQIVGLEVVLPDGRLLDLMENVPKVSRGIDLKQIFAGSEGTLGIVTAAVLRLQPLPSSLVTAWVGVGGIDAAVKLCTLLRKRCGHRLQAFEAVGRSQQEILFTYGGYTNPLSRIADWAIVVEVADTTSDIELQDVIEEALGEGITAGIVEDATFARNLQQVATFWKMRETMSAVNSAVGKAISHDTSVPLARLARHFSDVTAAILAEYPFVIPVASGHLADGNLHMQFLVPPDAQTLLTFGQIASGINQILFDAAERDGGVFSSEHGIGQKYIAHLEHYADEVELALMRGLKSMLDPRGIMNPGKILNCTPVPAKSTGPLQAP